MILRLTTVHENARSALECLSVDGLGAALERPRDFYRAGVSKAEIARRLQICRTSVRRILQERM